MSGLLSIGVDLIEIDRIAGACDRLGKRFLERVFRPEELAHCLAQRQPYPSMAARFAAKEAVAKALGVGFGAHLSFRDIGIINHPSGRPVIQLSGRAHCLLKKIGGGQILVSLSHHRTAAIAVVSILEG